MNWLHICLFYEFILSVGGQLSLSKFSIYSNEQILEAHNDEVWFLQFSHNGKYLASSSKDCSAIIWEVSVSSLFWLMITGKLIFYLLA